jgi:hypothetical protein
MSGLAHQLSLREQIAGTQLLNDLLPITAGYNTGSQSRSYDRLASSEWLIDFFKQRRISPPTTMKLHQKRKVSTGCLKWHKQNHERTRGRL